MTVEYSSKLQRIQLYPYPSTELERTILLTKINFPKFGNPVYMNFNEH